MATVEAVIVAGGLGSRLWPLTEHTPKPLLPVAGVPFVAHQLAKLAIAGVDCVVLATGYQAGQFERALGDGARWGIDLVHVAEPEPLGTAGAIRNAASHLTSGPSDPVVVLNSDILSGHDLTAQLNAHCQSGADVTLHLVEVPDARAYGCVSIDDTGRVQEFLEKSANPRSHLVNAGCYVFRRQVIDAIPASRAVSVERETFPGLVSGSAVVRGHRDDSYWRDLGTPAALVHASAGPGHRGGGQPGVPAATGASVH